MEKASTEIFRSIGEFIRTHRQQLGLSQKHVAIEAGYSPQLLSNVERDTQPPPPKMKQGLIKALKLDIKTWVEVETRLFKEELTHKLTPINANKDEI